MIIELPREVREVMVSNPDKMEAVLQTSTRAYLIGKAPGEANIIFIDKDGRQVVTLEITVERDLSALAGLLNRLIRGANIHVETVSGSVILYRHRAKCNRCHARWRNRHPGNRRRPKRSANDNFQL